MSKIEGRRRRPWRWVVSLGTSLALSTGAFVGYHIWRLLPSDARVEAAVAELTPLQDLSIEAMNEHVRSVQPPGANGWPLYVALFAEEFGYDGRRVDRNNANWTALFAAISSDVLLGELSDPRHDEPLAALAEIRHLLPMLDAAADAPGFAMPYAPASAGSEYEDFLQDYALMARLGNPLLGRMRTLARWNAFAMRVAAEEEQWEDVARRFRTGLSMSRQLSHQGTVIEWLVSISITSTTIYELRLIMMEHDVPADICIALLDILATRSWPAVAMSHPIAGERTLLLDFLDCMRAALRLYKTRDSLARRTEADLNILNELLNERWTLTPIGRIDRSPDPATDVAPLVGTLLPALGNALGGSRRIVSSQHALTALIRLRAYHARQGHWPERLLDAMSEEEATNPVLGIPLEYELHADSADADASAAPPFTLKIPLPPEFADEHLWDAPIDVTRPRDPLPVESDADDW